MFPKGSMLVIVDQRTLSESTFIINCNFPLQLYCYRLFLFFSTISMILLFEKMVKPSPIPLFNRTPQANQTALDKFRASSSVPSVFSSLNLPKGENRSRRYRTRATTCTDTITRIHRVLLNGCKNDTNVDDLDG